MKKFSFEAIGTRWEIETLIPLGTGARQSILDRIEVFEAVYSRFRADSLVSRIAAAPNGGCFDFPEDSLALFSRYDRLHAITAGAVDPLVGRTLELLGYDRNYTLKPTSDLIRQEVKESDRAVWSKDIIRQGSSLITRCAVVIDVGAVGKGYLVDIVSEILRDAGFDQFVVDGGGDIRHFGGSTLRVGLEHPFNPKMAIGVAALQGRALCASAVNRRAWGDGLHHVLDARTGLPVRDVVATWAVADDAATADGLATALFFVGQEQLVDDFDFEFVRMFADGHAEASGNFKGELYF